MNSLDLAKALLRVNPQLGAQADTLMHDSPLMGSMPEFNSLTVVSIVTGIEEQTGCAVSDTGLSAEIFETVGTLTDFIDSKLA